MAAPETERIILDYLGAPAANAKLLYNLSAVAGAGEYLWTASDEGRTVECLKPDGGGGYRLHQQYSLDTLFPALPKKQGKDDEGPPEADLESLAVHDGYLWICGSHCKVRRKPKKRSADIEGVQRVVPKFRERPSRHLLGRVRLTDDGGALVPEGDHLPFEKQGSLRPFLRKNTFLRHFVTLPSKENGLDIEGLALSGNSTVFLGLRGPLVDSFAVVIELVLPKTLTLKGVEIVTHFLDLGGLGVRDLTPFRDDILILAGPVSSLRGAFRIYRWHPLWMGDSVQVPDLLYPRPGDTAGGVAISADMARAGADEHPEGICLLNRGKEGLIVLYDNPHKSRIEGTGYTADWIPLA